MLVASVVFAGVFYYHLPYLRAFASDHGFFPSGERGIVFTGDLLLARDVEEHIKANDTSYPYARLDDLLKNNFVVVNFESAMAPVHTQTPDLTTKFSVDARMLPALKKAGVNAVSLANNHGFDYGEEGYENARSQLQSVGVQVFGNPESLIDSTITYMKQNDLKIALIGINLVTRRWSEDEVAEVLAQASRNSDRQVVFVHWGDEYQPMHNVLQELYAAWFVENGADLVIGHHPHVVQDVALYSGVPVFYSLGNFIFDQYFSDTVEEGLTLQVYFDTDQIRVTLLPVTSYDSHTQPRLMNEEETTAFLTALATRSDPVLSEMITRGRFQF